jgi:hypothetical protein
MYTRCPIEQDELENDTQTGKYAPFEEQFERIFIDDAEPLPANRKGTWINHESGFAVFREDK